MIIHNEKQAEVITEGITEHKVMSIDDSDKEVLMRIMSTGLYSDSIGSIIREWCSNGLDATRENGEDEPIIVSLKKDENGKFIFKVKDLGTGISPERYQNVLCKYAGSTKRDKPGQLGYFG